ncbi:hypothetical protein AMIS_340 [Actinoplanes missouriensis 431]|uniref:Uncharacterized protein n=1 Tax=Actinoplanes missouriensis (strain ATCC 14538 / DSM 43046 / CBS 188.64 / JCM 3121 / NBRC 102363 / NCIMB 12654 / NRRL B-3342 / UNCC 431) TaxID=512565 RepID=I0GWW7_ACTM4|nr:hypothetical protein [Actinoplanes missouriensis]BAL85254.1 hypothetical protein AMIS_340 [Actinoplanes missouriensis 431]
MAEKGWTSQAATAAGIAAGAGAAQLGLGYGLGVLVWPVTATESDSVWLGSLGWATWITASATVLGAVVAGRLRPDRPGRWRALWRFALATSSAAGALVAVALVALPARSAVRADALSPQLMAGGYALAGLLAGLIVAFWAVSSVPVAANLIGTALWLWTLAVAGVITELVTGRDIATYLTSWQFVESVSPIRYGGIYWPSALLTLTAAFVIGMIAAWPAARRGETGLGTAVSGAVGPLLVAFSFLVLAAALTTATGPLQSAYLIAPYAVLAGLAGSALTAAIGQSRQSRRARPDLYPVTAPPTEADSDEEPQHPAITAGDGPIPGTDAPVEPGPRPAPAPRQSSHASRAAPKPVNAPPSAPTPIGPPPSAPAGSPTSPVVATPSPQPTPAKATDPAKATGRAKPAPTGASATKDTAGARDEPAGPGASAAYADPEIAAAARPSRNPAKRTTGRKGDTGKPEGGTPRSTITPPPANPTVARINPSPEDTSREK